MPQSILEESRKARHGLFHIFFHKKFLIIAVIVLAALGVAYYFYWPKSSNQAAATVQKEATARQQNLQIAVSADGNVTARDEVTLSFPVTGNLTVSDVYVKEGDHVKKGDKIASVVTDPLVFSLRSAEANYQYALTNYTNKLDGPTSTQAGVTSINQDKSAITQAQISLDQSNASLTNTKSSVAQSIQDAQDALTAATTNLNENKDVNSSQLVHDSYTALLSNLNSLSVTLQNDLHDSDAIIGVDNTVGNLGFKNNLGIQNIGSLATAQTSYSVAKKAMLALDSALAGLDVSQRPAIDAAALAAESALTAMQGHLNDVQTVLDGSVASTNLSQSQLDGFKSSISSDRSGVTSAGSSLNGVQRTADNSPAGIQQYQISYDKAVRDLAAAQSQGAQTISNAETDVTSRQLALQDTQTAYANLIAPPKPGDMASLEAQLTSASVSLDQAKYNLSQATLVSPIDGIVSALNYKAGDIILNGSTTANQSVATIINNDTLYIEANVEEADISKLQIGQKVAATFQDVNNGLTVNGTTSYISLTSASNANGIVTYLVRVDIDNTNQQIRQGMTASVNFIIAEADNVLAIPVDAVLNISGSPSVQLKDGTVKPVVTGFTDGTNVAIISGLSPGDTVVY